MIDYKINFSLQQELHQKGYVKIPFQDICLEAMLSILDPSDKEGVQAILGAQLSLDFKESLLSTFLDFYYNSDNPAITEFAFETPSSDLISVGTIYFAVNYTDKDVLVADYEGDKVTLKPFELCLMNLGLAGIGFDLKITSLLQGVIHSSLDEINYFQGGEPLSQDSIRDIETVQPNIFENTINFNTWVDLGFAVNSVKPEYADHLRSLVKKEHYKSVEQNQLDEYCGYADRFISKHSFFKPRAIKAQYQDLLDEVNQLATPILINKPNPNGDNLSVFAATKGHFMDSHADCADGSPLITIVYLSDDEFGEGDGGDISSARVDICPETKRLVERAVKDAKAPPKHGFAIHVNNSDIRFVHEVHEILSEKFRYSIIMNSSMLTNPNWEKDFEEIEGHFETDTSKLDKPE